MSQLILQCNLWGKKLSPQKVDSNTGLSLSSKLEPGEITKNGRYKGKPLPYGSATLECPVEWDWFKKWNWALTKIEGHIEIFKEYGAKEITLHLVYYHEGQCNLEFTPEELKRIADLSIPFTISCFREE